MSGTVNHLGERLSSVVDATRVAGGTATLADYAIDEMAPSAVVRPANAAEVAEIVRFALAEKLAIISVGNRSKLGIGMPPSRYDIALDMTAMHQIANYDPGDLTVSVDAGCTLSSIDAALYPNRQFLPLTSTFGGHSTAAGTIASGIDSHLRQLYGTARDFLVGAEFVDGTGAQCKSGGRVVKNVTGYDLHKLLIGSLGTLAVITRLNFRTFPSLNSEEAHETLVASFSSAPSAIDFRQKIAASPFAPHAVEIFSPEMNQIFCAVDSLSWEPPREPLGAWFSPARWQVVVLFSGPASLRARYAAALAQLAGDAGAVATHTLPVINRPAHDINLGEAHTLNVFVVDALRRLRSASSAATIFKIAQLPAALPALFAELENAAERSKIPHALFARGVGITYFGLLPPDSGDTTMARLAQAAESIFRLCAVQSATAQMQFAPTALKRRLNILGPERPDFAAMRRLKSAFDPHNIFAPGRLL